MKKAIIITTPKGKKYVIFGAPLENLMQLAEHRHKLGAAQEQVKIFEYTDIVDIMEKTPNMAKYKYDIEMINSELEYRPYLNETTATN
jgi:hypothetical protein